MRKIVFLMIMNLTSITLACPAGQELVDSKCISCKAGYYSLENEDVCTICPAGYKCPNTNERMNIQLDALEDLTLQAKETINV